MDIIEEIVNNLTVEERKNLIRRLIYDSKKDECLKQYETPYEKQYVLDEKYRRSYEFKTKNGKR